MKVPKKHANPLHLAITYGQNDAITEKWYMMADTDSGTLLPMYWGKRELSMQGDAEAAAVVTVRWTAEQSASPEMQDKLWQDSIRELKTMGVCRYNAQGNLAVDWTIIDA